MPAGSPRTDVVTFHYTIFYLPRPANDPIASVEKHAEVRRVTDIPAEPRERVVSASMDLDVPRNYAVPDPHSLKYFGRGLSDDQVRAVQRSQHALVLGFAHPQRDVWRGLRHANELAAAVADDTGGLIWDDETRELFTPEAWEEQRLARWTGEIPAISDHMTIHFYEKDDAVRAVTLGMKKFGLPDVVLDGLAWSLQRNVGHIINLFCQAMAEGATLDAGRFDLHLRRIRDASVRDPQLAAIPGGTGVARLALREGIAHEGDPDNRLVQIFPSYYPGNDDPAKLDAMLTTFFGATDSVAMVDYTNAELRAASAAAREKLPALRSAFNSGLDPGEYILVKAPFAAPDGNKEWMWVEVARWDGEEIRGTLRNDPQLVRDLHAGQMVEISEADVFDYIRHYPDGRKEGNSTGEVISRMNR
ncbi:MAG TPA: DUF2314 domain-containing protein [Vicinamibacterales bacterium]|nr:DUF2314 domain-containing protein [Vicinamibacterales bacterium]